MIKVLATVELDALDVVADHHNETVLEFIKQIDLEMADWDFTLKLYEYFATQKAEYDKEVAAESKS